MNEEIRIKVCGLKDPENILEVAALKPDYMGFILYRKSKRFISLDKIDDIARHIPRSILKVGVIVDEPLEEALNIAQSGIFDLLQLHGAESIDYCRRLSSVTKLIKAFSISKSLPANLSDYEEVCSLFLFDTAGENAGGNGKMFDHSILNKYSYDTGYMLSGGISPGDNSYLKSFPYNGMAGVDLNSRFETEPGIKNIDLLKGFIEKLRKYD
jgi:phosphoribosylanthranilate isomerase